MMPAASHHLAGRRGALRSQAAACLPASELAMSTRRQLCQHRKKAAGALAVHASPQPAFRAGFESPCHFGKKLRGLRDNFSVFSAARAA
jgi:hypothetical protein